MIHARSGWLFALALTAGCRPEPAKQPQPSVPALAAPRPKERALHHPPRLPTMQPVDDSVSVVDWHSLIPLFKDRLGEWTATAPLKGTSSAASGQDVTTVEGSWRRGKTVAHVHVSDAKYNLAIAAGFRAARVEKKEPDHWIRPLEIAGQPALAQWRNDRTGKVTVLCGPQIFLEVSAEAIDDTAGLEALAAALDPARLATLGK